MPVAPETVMRSIGQRIAELRVERGLTQQQVADRLGITSRYVQKVEAGGANLSIRALVDWCNVLRVPLAAFLERPKSTKKAKAGRPRKAGRKPTGEIAPSGKRTSNT